MFATLSRFQRPRSVPIGLGVILAVAVAIAVFCHTPRAWAQSSHQYDSFRNDPFLALMPKGHYSEITSLVFLPDGLQILSAGRDKTVQVWGLNPGEPPWRRTLRPPQWRGLAGSIFAMAIQPKASADGQRLLAVAGQGVQTTGGNIALFRFPGLRDVKTGDLVGHLISAGVGAARTGHDSSVYAMAFHPNGARLATAGGDQTIIIWDTTTRKPVATLRGHAAPVRAVSYSPNGQQLISAGDDGTIRLWTAAGALVRTSAAPPANANALDRQLLCMAISPRGDFAIAGRRDGKIVRFALPSLTETILNPQESRGDITAVALSPDGRSLAVCGLRDRMPTAADRPVLTSTLELWSLAPAPQAPTKRTTKSHDGWLRACAFSPDGQRLAYGGGQENAVRVQSVAELNQGPAVLQAGGRSILDVGFTADGSTIAYSSSWPEQPGVRQGFHLTDKRFLDVESANVRRLAKTGPSGSIAPLSQYRFRIAPAGGQAREIELDPGKDGRWYSYGIIPATPAHPVALAAIACEGGVKIHRMDSGGLTRYYAGHAGPVYSMSASPDGQWLITGSSDQTVKLWALRNAHLIPALGATFQRRDDGEYAVASVAKYSFAELMGLKVGDRVEWSAIGKQRYARRPFPNEPTKTPEQFLQDLPTVRPNAAQIQFLVRRADRGPDGKPIEKQLGFPTTKRDAPAANFYATDAQDWLIWMQQGFYDTSIRGDDSLGWHVNRAWVEDPPAPTDAFGIREYEGRFFKPDVIRTLLRTGSVTDALAAAVPPPPPNPPRFELAEPTRSQLQPAPGLNAARFPLEGEAPKLSLTILLNPDQTIAAPLEATVTHDTEVVHRGPFPAAVGAPREMTTWTPQPGPHSLTVVLKDRLGGVRRQTYPYEGVSKPRPQANRLIFLTIGEGKFDGLPPIPQASGDLRELSRHFRSRMADGDGSRFKAPFLPITAKDQKEEIIQALKRLNGEAKKGDAVLVAIESHHLRQTDGKDLLAVAGTSPPSFETAVSTSEISAALGSLADRGCRVFVLLDCVHDLKPAEGASSDVKTWARELRDRNVTAIVASQNGPSQVRDAQGAFAVGLTAATGPQGPKLDEVPEGKPFNLYQYERVAVETVQGMTNRKQHPLFNVPPTVSHLQFFVFP